MQIVVRGTTVQFSTNFYDVNGDLTQPATATINIVYSTAAEDNLSTKVAMTPPGGDVTTWTALWDTRGVLARRTIYWSIHTGSSAPIPVAVEDGEFQLDANPANLPTF
jgi:hypothetical protein